MAERELTVEQVIELVLQARARTFNCQGCGRETSVLIPPTSFGRLPVMCEECWPKSQTWARERAERPLRAAIVQLDGELQSFRQRATAERVARGGDESLARRSYRLGRPSKELLGRMIRRVAHARGRRETAEALLDLAAVAQAWAGLLSAPTSLSITEALDPELREAG